MNIPASGPSSSSSGSFRSGTSSGVSSGCSTQRAPLLAEGSVLDGRYRVVRVIGSGGMGSVYEGVDQESGMRVAIKALKRSLTRENLRRFLLEAKAASQLQHPNVCRAYDLRVDNGAPFMVMEHLVGETVRRRIANRGAFSVPETITIAIQLLDALSAAHASGVLHRDVNPGNMVITTPPEQVPFIKLIDFGLSRPLDETSSSEITTTGMIPGTPAYLSPEQVTGERNLDEGVDIWAAALTTFEMLTARRGFKADNFDALAERIAFEPAPSVRRYRTDVPREVDRVLAKALAKRRSHRWSSAMAFRTALVEAWARHRLETFTGGAGVVPPPSSRRVPRRR